MPENLFQNLMRAFTCKKMIYLDHAATTPLDPEVYRTMSRVLVSEYANPGAIHSAGIHARQVITMARRSVAQLLGTTSDHIIFTRGGTESNSGALQGVINRAVSMMSNARPHVISSVIEHAAVLETLRALEQAGTIELTLVEVDAQGIVNMDELKKVLRPETVLVSVMYVNNEIGTIQPIREIAKLIRWYRKQLGRSGVVASAESYPVFHVDAIQAVNYLDIHVERLGVDLMSLSGSKIYGPKSSGVLFVRDRSLLAPIMFGGDQEFGLRPGTEDVVQIIGFTQALERVRLIADTERARLELLRDEFIELLEKKIPDIMINGSRTDRIANNVSITIPGISGERLVIELDARGIWCASKSACKEDSGEASHVLTAIHNAAAREKSVRGSTKKDIRTETDGAVRFSLGQGTTRRMIQYAAQTVSEVVATIRAFEKTISRK